MVGTSQRETTERDREARGSPAGLALEWLESRQFLTLNYTLWMHSQPMQSVFFLQVSISLLDIVPHQ